MKYVSCQNRGWVYVGLIPRRYRKGHLQRGVGIQIMTTVRPSAAWLTMNQEHILELTYTASSLLGCFRARSSPALPLILEEDRPHSTYKQSRIRRVPHRGTY